MKNNRKLFGWILTGLICLIFTFSGVMKLLGSQEVIDGFQKMGLGDNARIGIGLTEIICTIIFAIPRTGVLGTVLLIGYMGGVILAHLQSGMPVIPVIILGITIGLVGYIRFPELGGRLFGKNIFQ